MASRVLIRFAGNARTLAFKPRLSFPYQWRCVSSVSTWRSNCLYSCKYTANLSYQNTSRVEFMRAVRGYASEAMTLQQLEEKVMDVIKLYDKVDSEKVSLEANFVDDLGVDSLDIVEIVMALEDELGVEISDEEAEKILSAKDAVDLLKKLMDIH